MSRLCGKELKTKGKTCKNKSEIGMCHLHAEGGNAPEGANAPETPEGANAPETPEGAYEHLIELLGGNTEISGPILFVSANIGKARYYIFGDQHGDEFSGKCKGKSSISVSNLILRAASYSHFQGGYIDVFFESGFPEPGKLISKKHWDKKDVVAKSIEDAIIPSLRRNAISSKPVPGLHAHYVDVRFLENSSGPVSIHLSEWLIDLLTKKLTPTAANAFKLLANTNTIKNFFRYTIEDPIGSDPKSQPFTQLLAGPTNKKAGSELVKSVGGEDLPFVPDYTRYLISKEFGKVPPIKSAAIKTWISEYKSMLIDLVGSIDIERASTKDIEIAEICIGSIDLFAVDVYTVCRMMTKATGDVWYYGGAEHSTNIIRFLEAFAPGRSDVYTYKSDQGEDICGSFIYDHHIFNKFKLGRICDYNETKCFKVK